MWVRFKIKVEIEVSDVSIPIKTANRPIIVVAQQDSSCGTTFEVQSPVVIHARLGQTPVGGPP